MCVCVCAHTYESKGSLMGRQRSAKHCFTRQMAATGEAKQKAGVHLGLPREWQGFKHLGHLLLPFQSVSRELQWKWGRQDSSQHLCGMMIPQAADGGLLCYATTLPLYYTLLFAQRSEIDVSMVLVWVGVNCWWERELKQTQRESGLKRLPKSDKELQKLSEK